MQIHVLEIPEKGIQRSYTCRLNKAETGLEGAVAVNCAISKIDNIVFIQGAIKARVGFTCSRCLETFEDTIQTQIDMQCLPSEKESLSEEEQELPDEELNTLYYQDETINIDDIAIEQVLLNAPIKPLCHNQCKGLCVVCGIDLNKSSCNCKKEEIDPRFALLEKMKKGAKNG